MRAFRAVVTALLVIGLSTPAFAGDPGQSVAKPTEQEKTRPKRDGSRAIMAAGAGLFVAGMGVGLYGFMNNKNGEFSEFGEANAVNKTLGAAGVSAAFAGGILIFFGSRAKRAPSVTVGAGQVTVSKRISW